MLDGFNRRQVGQEGEDLAERFLRARGYTILARNYRCRVGEIDVVALNGDTVVFIEVRTLRGCVYGNPLESVDRRKQRQVAKAAAQYLAYHRLSDRAARFDVIGVQGTGAAARVSHVVGAFELPPG